MFNHHYDKLGQTYWQYEDSDEAFHVNAQREISSGDAVRYFNYIDRYVKITDKSLITDSYSIMDF